MHKAKRIRFNQPDNIRLVVPALCLSIFFFLPLQAQTRIDSIRLKPEKTGISNIFSMISEKTGYFFTYNPERFNDKDSIIPRENYPELTDLLADIARSQHSAFRIIDRNIVFFRTEVPANPDQIIPVAEEITMIRGIVTDSRNGKPLPFANIALYGTSTGTTGNLSGEFNLKIPSVLKDFILVVSYIGYSSKVLTPDKITDQSMTIALERRIVSLQEVIIRYQDPYLLMEDAIRKIPGNNYNEHAALQAYYREAVRRNNRMMMFTEAMLEIAKEPYNLSPSLEKVRILKGRQIKDIQASDTILLRIRSGIGTALLLDVAKNLPDFLSEERELLYIFKMEDILSFGDRLVYRIAFSPRQGNKDALYRGNVYIDMEDLSIPSVDFEFDPSRISQAAELFTIKKGRGIRLIPVSASYHTNYREIEGTQHLGMVRADVRFKIKKRKSLIASDYRLAIDMAVTEVAPGTRLRLRQGESLNPDAIVSEFDFPTDPGFWGNYTIIEPEASLQEILNKIAGR